MTIFFKTSEHTVRGMAGYAGKPISMVSIFLHDCKEPDMVGLIDGNSPKELRTHTLVGHDKQYVCSSIGVQTYSSRELSQSGACGSNDLLVGYVDINFSSMWVTESYVTQRKLLSLVLCAMK